MTNYFTIEDLEQLDVLSNPFMTGVRLTNNCKCAHNITGWVGLTVIWCDGRLIPVADLWTGFKYERLPECIKTLNEYCKQANIEIR